MNSTYSQSEFTLDEGEKLLKEMQDLREDLSHYSNVVEALHERSREVVPLKQRRQSLRQPITVTSICNYKQVEVNLDLALFLFYLAFLNLIFPVFCLQCINQKII